MSDSGPCYAAKSSGHAAILEVSGIVLYMIITRLLGRQSVVHLTLLRYLQAST
jgi:uncharacterized membrane protein YcaP (DUF421 family)